MLAETRSVAEGQHRRLREEQQRVMQVMKDKTGEMLDGIGEFLFGIDQGVVRDRHRL